MQLIPCLGCLCFVLFRFLLSFAFVSIISSGLGLRKQQVDTLPAFVKHLLSLLPSPLISWFFCLSFTGSSTHTSSLFQSPSHWLPGFSIPPVCLSLALSFSSLSFSHLCCFASTGFYGKIGSLPVFSSSLFMFFAFVDFLKDPYWIKKTVYYICVCKYWPFLTFTVFLKTCICWQMCKDEAVLIYVIVI